MSKKETSKFDPRKLALHAIRVLHFSYQVSDEYLANPREVRGVALHIDKEFAFQLKENAVLIRLQGEIQGQGDEESPLGVEARFLIEFYFSVENLKEFTRTERDGSVAMELLLAASLLSIAYSTARGILFERLKGTVLERGILPIIDPKEFALEESSMSKEA